MVFKVYSDGSGMTGGPAGIGFVAYVDGELLLKGNRAVARATRTEPGAGNTAWRRLSGCGWHSR